MIRLPREEQVVAERVLVRAPHDVLPLERVAVLADLTLSGDEEVVSRLTQAAVDAGVGKRVGNDDVDGNRLAALPRTVKVEV